jgi:hypothetical protein
MLKNFEILLNEAQNHINVIRAMIKTNAKLREIIYENKLPQKIQTQKELQELKTIVPELSQWKIYDHCAVVTQLYSIYEGFVTELIKSWIGELPKIYPKYSDLEEVITKTHQSGVVQILLKPQKVKRVRTLSVEEIIRGLYLGVTASSSGYELLPQAFVLHEQNLRKDTFNKLLANAGISDAWTWIIKHRKVISFEQEFLEKPDNTESTLKELIDYRNEASHGYNIDPLFTPALLNPQELIKLCNFIENLCQAIIELVNYHIIESKIKQGQAKKIGKITEWFPNPQACVAKISDTSLSTGDSVILKSRTKSYCQLARIENIQIDNKDQQKVTITSETEVGIKFNLEAEEGLEIVIVK